MTQPTLSARLPTAWREFAQFLHQPRMADPIGLRAGWRTVLAMLALNLVGLALLLLTLPVWQHLTGIDGPSAFKGIPMNYLVPAVIVAAPVIEETVFRGWLSGRPRALWLLGCLVAAVLALALLQPGSARAGLALLVLLVVALVGWLVLRRRAAPAWFGRSFPAIYFLSAVLFGLIHLFNYAAPGLAHLPMVLPQLWAGLTLGFVRTRVGLPGSMLVHGASNGLALGLVGLGG